MANRLRLIMIAACVALSSHAAADVDNAALPLGPEELQDTADAEPSPAGHVPENRRTFLADDIERHSLSKHIFGLGDRLEQTGITTTLNLWILYQANLFGGLDQDADFNGLYYLANHFDLERLAGLPAASVFLRVDGGWGDGIDESVGTIVNVNGVAVGDEPIGITRLWVDQDLFDQRLRFRVGKLDITTESFDFHGQNATFDATAYAGTPRGQFLDAGLVNNASVPFPESGFGAMALTEPIDRIYVAATAVQADADQFTLSNPFDGNSKWMYAAEAGGVTPPSTLPGLYYAGYWHSEFEDDPSAWGLYLGASQLVLREPGTDAQGLGLFARYGYAEDNPSGIRHAWSLGASARGLLDGRDADVLALGWTQHFTNGAEFSVAFEGALELYYRARVTAWFHLSGHAQYIANPGSQDIDNALTLAIRAQVTF